MNVPQLPARYFNQLSYDARERCVIKRSRDENKLSDEICWYLDLPERCKQVIPQIYDYSLEPGNVYLKLQFIPWPTLSDCFLALENKSELLQWEQAFEDLRAVLRMFACYRREPDFAAFQAMYFDKTYERLDQFTRNNQWAQALLKQGYLMVNGRRLPSPLVVLERERSVIDALLYEGTFQIIHGDFCFPNILYDRSTRALKLIDPRGSFGASGLFGDVRYDLAKIRHSLSGYDQIVRDRFVVRLSGNRLDLSLGVNSPQRALRQMWDHSLGKQLPAVKLIESLLFLSMLPLHRDQPYRQMAMYTLGAELLCSCIYD